MAVVSMQGAERLGRVSDVLFETAPFRVAALAIDTVRGQRAVAISDIDRVGDDAIIVETRESAASNEPQLAIDHMPGLSALDKLKVVDDRGTFLGHVDRVEVDPSTGAIGVIDVTRSGTFGLRGETTTIDIDQVESVGEELITVRRK